LIWAIVGFFLGQIRTLNKLGLLANFAVVINLLIMFISMGVMAHSEPNYLAAQAGSAGAALGGASVQPFANGTYPPVQRYGSPPPSTNGFIGSINGLMNGVYAYGGAQLFIEFMAELQRPRDFLKAMWGAQFFIYACYMSYGSFVYYYQGQYSNQVSSLLALRARGARRYNTRYSRSSTNNTSSLIKDYRPMHGRPFVTCLR
jgi:hypothetical protein